MAAFYPLEYFSVLKRWKWVFIIVFLTIAVLSFLYAKNWSAYSAAATVEVAMPEIEMETLNAGETAILTGEAIADLRISRLKQKVLSTNSLAEVIAKLDLYPGARKSKPVSYIAQQMRANISFELIGNTLTNSSAAQKASASDLSAIAFTIAFTYSDPELTQKAVNELVSRFLNEDIKERREMAEKTSAFLQSQIENLNQSLEEKEKEIAQFRAENGYLQSDSLTFNREAAMSSTSRLLSLDSEITSIMGRIGALRSQLAQTDPYSQVVDSDGDIIETPGAQLRALETRYASLTARYGPEHPDVIKTRREINALRQGGNTSNRMANIRNADNPAYLQILTQLESAQEQMRALEDQKERVQEQQEEYDLAVQGSPEAEQRMASLTRDYENMMTMYRTLKAKKLASDINQEIEQGHVGQRLALIDPADVPLATNPSRKVLFAGGLIFAFIAASASVVGLQFLSQTVIGPHHLQSLVGVAPLVKVPHIKRQNLSNATAFEKTLDENRIVAHRTRSKEADAFRFLRTQILQKMHKEGYKTLAISSPRYGDGKSTIATNLAVSIAQDLKQTALLVDLDLRNPSLTEFLGVEANVGLTDYLSNTASVKDCLVRPDFERISLFPAGHAIDQSSESLGSPEMEKLADELRQRYDDRLIIYDLPPLLQQDDPLVFLPHVDAFVLTVCEGKTTTDEVRRSLEILESANVLGIVLNEA